MKYLIIKIIVEFFGKLLFFFILIIGYVLPTNAQHQQNLSQEPIFSMFFYTCHIYGVGALDQKVFDALNPFPKPKLGNLTTNCPRDGRDLSWGFRIEILSPNRSSRSELRGFSFCIELKTIVSLTNLQEFGDRKQWIPRIGCCRIMKQ